MCAVFSEIQSFNFKCFKQWPSRSLNVTVNGAIQHEWVRTTWFILVLWSNCLRVVSERLRLPLAYDINLQWFSDSKWQSNTTADSFIFKEQTKGFTPLLIICYSTEFYLSWTSKAIHTVVFAIICQGNTTVTRNYFTNSNRQWKCAENYNKWHNIF